MITAPAQETAARFTRDGSDALEQLLHDICEETGRGVRDIVPADRLEALILGGGYGRGEGGVLATQLGDAPYNDLEFFLLIKGAPRQNERAYGAAIERLAHRMTEKLGIEVEFKIISLEKLQRSPVTMFYYDLVKGHRVIAGPSDILKTCTRHADAGRIPLHEATRLLMNRCSGLLYAAERLARPDFTAEDADFTARNIAKAQLALGDVVLTAGGNYHWSCLERHARLERLEEPALPMGELTQFHNAGVAFKLHPARSAASRGELAALHRRVSAAAKAVWMWLEQKRLGSGPLTPLAYSTSRLNKCPESLLLKNPLLRLRTFGVRGLLHPSAFRYPREGLLNSLPLLLWEPQAVAAHRSHLSRQLGVSIASWQDAVTAYARLWARYN